MVSEAASNRFHSYRWFILICSSALFTGGFGVAIYHYTCLRICGPVVSGIVPYIPRHQDAILLASSVTGIALGLVLSIGYSAWFWVRLRQKWWIVCMIPVPFCLLISTAIVMGLGESRTDAIDRSAELSALGVALGGMLLTSVLFGALMVNAAQNTKMKTQNILIYQIIIWFLGGLTLCNAGYIGSPWALISGWIVCWSVIAWGTTYLANKIV